jgi:hypothetical protein
VIFVAEVSETQNGVERPGTTNKWEGATEFADRKAVELESSTGDF